LQQTLSVLTRFGLN